MRRTAWLSIAVMLTACEQKPPATTVVDTLHAFADTVTKPVVGDDTLLFERTRTFDFDGDGVPETMNMRAVGAHWDAMRIDLAIRSPRGLVIWADSLSTMGYLGQEADPNMPRAAIDSTVKMELANFLSDNAFQPTADNFDDDNINLRDTYARAIYQRRYRGDISDAHDDSIYAQRVRELNIPEAEYVRFEQELMSRPMFKYYLGGESSTGITWSSMLDRFVETWVCC